MAKQTAHIGDLKSDPRNARKHNPRNIGTIVDAMQKVGAARSVVIDENNVILAGNGAVEAASEAGIEKVLIVETDGNTLVAVRRSGLTDEQKTKLALADNRAGELAEWDVDVLKDLHNEGTNLGEFWTAKELAKLFDMEPAKELQPPTTLQYRVVVECDHELHQTELLDRFAKEGLRCQPLIS